MGIMKKPLLLLLFFLVVSITEKSSVVEARTLSLLSRQGYSKIFGTLGVVCKCCDGIEGACTSTWKDSCSNLQCLPWRSY